MNKSIYITFFITIALTFFGCSNTYLDEPIRTDAVTQDVIFSTPSTVRTFFSGIYRRFRRQWERTDVGGVYSIFYARAVKGTFMINRTWYGFDYRHVNREPTFTRVRETWKFCYYVIGQLNNMIDGLNNKLIVPEEEKAPLLAEARGLRAFFYFQLALEYCSAYPSDPTFPAPPIYKEPKIEGNPMSTLEEMYTFINEDLDYAIANLKEARLDKSNLNLTVAKGLKIRVLMAQNKGWNEIETLAPQVYGSVDDATAGNYKDGFDDSSRSDWLWAMIQTSDQTNYYYAAPSAFVDPTGAYKGISITNKFVNSFSSTDVRNTFYDAAGRNKTTKYKFAFTTDILIMRKAEFLLAYIEALYRNNKKTEAHNLLFQLQQKRDPQAVKSTNTNDALLDEILEERVKELYIELGVEWFDAKRLEKPLIREGVGFEDHVTQVSLIPNDKRFYLKIPQVEIDANPEIDASVNADR